MAVPLITKEEIAAEIKELDADIIGWMVQLRMSWTQVKELAEANLGSADAAEGPDPLPALSNKIAEDSRQVRRCRDKRTNLLLRLGEMALKECRS